MQDHHSRWDLKDSRLQEPYLHRHREASLTLAYSPQDYPLDGLHREDSSGRLQADRYLAQILPAMDTSLQELINENQREDKQERTSREEERGRRGAQAWHRQEHGLGIR